MKNVLITGATSYVGTSVAKWLGNYPDDFSVDLISVRDKSWRSVDFSRYDAVLHAAGIAHIKETEKNAALYYKVNRDLAHEVALEAKSRGVKQFIFLSSMSVYGVECGIIDRNTSPNPNTNYGISKLEAEELIENLEESEFKVAIVRPPMIYGRNCKGNYGRLSKIVMKVPFFPLIKNMRSMIYIDNLCEFMRVVIENNHNGVFFPQNYEYVSTVELVTSIASAHNKRIILVPKLDLIMKLKNELISKLFGDLVYDKSISNFNFNYNKYDFYSSIQITEKRVVDVIGDKV